MATRRKARQTADHSLDFEEPKDVVPRKRGRQSSRASREDVPPEYVVSQMKSDSPHSGEVPEGGGRRLRRRGQALSAVVQSAARGFEAEELGGADSLNGKGGPTSSKASSGGEGSDGVLQGSESTATARGSDKRRNGRAVVAAEGVGRQQLNFDELEGWDDPRTVFGGAERFAGKELVNRAGGPGKVLAQIGPGRPTPGLRRSLPVVPSGGLRQVSGERFGGEGFAVAIKQPRGLERNLSSGKGGEGSSSGGEEESDLEADGFSSDEDLKLSLVERKDSPVRELKGGKKALRSEESDKDEEELESEDDHSAEVGRREEEARMQAEEEERLREEEEKERQREIERLKEVEWQKEEARRRDEERKRGEERWREERQRKERERRKELERQKKELERAKEEKRAAEEKAREARETAARQAQRTKMGRQLNVLQRIQATIVAAKKARTGGVGPRKGVVKIVKEGPSPDEFVIDAKVVKKQRSMQPPASGAPKLETVRVSMLDIAAAAEEMNTSRPRSAQRRASPGVNSPSGANAPEASRLGRRESFDVEESDIEEFAEARGTENRGVALNPGLQGTPQAKKEPRFMAAGSFSDDSDEGEFVPADDGDLLIDVNGPAKDAHVHAPNVNAPFSGADGAHLSANGVNVTGGGVNMPMYGGVGWMGMKRKAFEEEEAEGTLHVRGFEGFGGDANLSSAWRGDQGYPQFDARNRPVQGARGKVLKQLKRTYSGADVSRRWPSTAELRLEDGSGVGMSEREWAGDIEGSETSGAARGDLEGAYSLQEASEIPLELAVGEVSEEDDVAGYLAVDHQDVVGLGCGGQSRDREGENGIDAAQSPNAIVPLGNAEQSGWILQPAVRAVNVQRT